MSANKCFRLFKSNGNINVAIVYKRALTEVLSVHKKVRGILFKKITFIYKMNIILYHGIIEF